MLQWFSRLKEWNSRRLQANAASRWSQWEISEFGIQIHLRNRAPIQFTWIEIEEIVTYKRSLGTSDQICLAIRIRGEEGFFSINEDSPYWGNAVEALESQFQLPKTWYGDVMLPPFETKWTTLWPNHSMQPTAPLRGPAADFES